MKKLISLIRASMTDNMNIFKIKSNSSKKPLLPIILAIICMFSIGSYANMIVKSLTSIHAEYILLSLFVIIDPLIVVSLNTNMKIKNLN